MYIIQIICVFAGIFGNQGTYLYNLMEREFQFKSIGYLGTDRVDISRPES